MVSVHNQKKRPGRADQEARSTSMLHTRSTLNSKTNWYAEYQRMKNNIPWDRKTDKRRSNCSSCRQYELQSKTDHEKVSHYILAKGNLKENEAEIINIHVPNASALNHRKQILADLKNQIDTQKIIEGASVPHSHKNYVTKLSKN